ncbi:hypothetical protein LCG94_22055 [Aeromonas salmonicida]|uniref:hypothetical protein n=1 Tax=Aeromonas salmonicida TaxID=645 RepID=UPI001863D899|nr:hypothetical protein [Aeromonas salmonicida]MDF8329650.1 hypothetical protein [Aeromonas salmonicida]
MNPFKRYPTINRGALLLSLLVVQGTAFAAPPSKGADGNDIKIDLDWDDKEYDWWQNHCLDLEIGDGRIQLNCDKMDGKYRDHYNRSIHSGNNPGQGHDKHKSKSNGNGNGKKN